VEVEMGYLVVNTSKSHELDAGKTKEIWWNNAAPGNAVWSANAVPASTGSTQAGFSQDTQLEVTCVWRRYKVVEEGSGQISDVDIEHEIHCEVKNVGGSKARLSCTSPRFGSGR